MPTSIWCALRPAAHQLHSESDGGKTQLTDVEGVYKLIVDDLTKAESFNLPHLLQGRARNMFGCDVYVTQQAVKSTLAAVYMAMAGYPLNKGQEYYAKAADAAEAVIKGGGKRHLQSQHGCRVEECLLDG